MPASKLFGIIILSCLVNFNSLACSCDTIPFKEAIASTEEIFVGKIVKAERFENGKFLSLENNEEISWGWRYHFEIQKKWKGNKKANLILYDHGTSCDFLFDINESEYLVYASRYPSKEAPAGIAIGPNNGKEKYTTWLCSRTIANRNWEEDNWANDDIKKLDIEYPNAISLSRIALSKNWIILISIGLFLLFGKLIKRRSNRIN